MMTLRDYIERKKNGRTKPTRPEKGKKNNRRKTKRRGTQRRSRQTKTAKSETGRDETRSIPSTTPRPSEILSGCVCGKTVKYAGILICEDCFVDKVVACDPKLIHNINTLARRRY